MQAPPIPAAIAAAFSAYPAPMQDRFQTLRALIFAVAAQTPGVGPLTESLKWGEPAYRPRSSGTTVRLASVKSAPAACAVLVPCQTTLIEGFRGQFPDAFRYDGNRAILINADGPLPEAALRLCLRAALTYHQGG